ncbi:hypothetical protein [Streptomyces sp. 6N223]|uniref:hypothetical protein n=1 Tax=Streptomyces sp. 6N223 TaxID=3457412 RepID=UPI003FD1BBD8
MHVLAASLDTTRTTSPNTSATTRGIEALHPQRNVTIGEDASEIHTGSPRVMAGLRNTALGLADLVG